MITRLHVENYKSLKDIDLRLEPLNIIVGSNNAGKSNIMDSLVILSEFATIGRAAVESRGGFSDLVWNADLKRAISFELEGEFPGKPKQRYTYQLELTGGPVHFSFAHEQFSRRAEKILKKVMELESSSSQYNIFNDDGTIAVSASPGTNESYLRWAKNPIHSPILARFADDVSNWVRYQFVPGRLRELAGARRELRLTPSGDNLSAVLHSIQTEYPRDFQKIKEMLIAIVPQIEDIYAPLTEQGRSLIRTHEEGLTFFPPLWSFSDGTLQSLAVLVALYSPNPAPLICFEEPENYIHPRALYVLAEAFKEASEKSQIIISTHSPYLLDVFEVDNLIIVERERGSTRVRRPGRVKGVKEALKVLGLGEAWYAGSLGGVP